MNGKKAAVALAVLTLLVFVCIGYNGAPESAAQRLSSIGSGSGRAGPGDIPPDCSTLDVVALTPNVSSFRNKVLFQVRGSLWCNWTASSSVLLEDVAPAEGAGTQNVGGTLPPNSNEQSRIAEIRVASADGSVVRTATVTQAAAVWDCTGVSAQPTSIWPPGAFINVTVPAGWTWRWNPITNLLRYNCTPNYPTGVDCRWQCSYIEPRHGYAEIIAWGEGRRCTIPITGDQTRCP
jgi:hypothetical protein